MESTSASLAGNVTAGVKRNAFEDLSVQIFR